jgi:ornithine--oxo-acid transaminase
LDLTFPPKKTIPYAAVKSTGGGNTVRNLSSAKTTTAAKTQATKSKSPQAKATSTSAKSTPKAKQTMSTSPKKTTTKKQPQKAATTTTTTSTASEEEEEAPKRVKRAATASKAPAKGKPTPAKKTNKKQQTEDEDIDEEEIVEIKKAPKKASAKAKKAQETGEEEEEIIEIKKAPKKASAKAKKAQETEEEEEVKATPTKPKAKQAKKTVKEDTDEDIEEVKPTKKAPAKKTAKVVEMQEEEVVEVVMPKTKKSTKAKTKTADESKEDDIPVQTTNPKGRPGAKKKKATDNVIVVKKIGTVPEDTPLSTKRWTTNELGIYHDYIETISSETTKKIIKNERQFLCNNYAPLPVVLKQGDGIYVKDVDNNWFMDFLSAYSAINHGHNNEYIIKKAFEQMNSLYMTARAFYNTKLSEAAEMVCKLFNYEKVLFMNTGVEAGESAIKIARRWGYMVKNIPDDQAKVVFAKGNFWGRTIYACGTSDDPTRYEKFGPFDRASSYLVEYNNISELEQVLVSDPTICAVFLEPIQGENGIIIPDKDYFYNVKRLCEKYNCLFIDDEIQAGLGRAGFPLYTNYMDTKPDIVLLGKSLSGGIYPVSAVLSSAKIMDLIKPGEHGSTYGGNPLAAQVTMAALSDFNSKGLAVNSLTRGNDLGVALRELEKNKFIREIRGRGLMFGFELHPDCPFNAYDLSLWLMERGLLTKSTKTYCLR